MPTEQFVDYYETMQISPNADLDTIHRVYRILAQRFHPDNQETGNVEVFRDLTEAYRVLSDPEQRAAFDIAHREARRITWQIFDQTTSSQGVEAERRKRSGVLSLLYRKRLVQPDQPAMSIRDFEEFLAVPKEHLEFTLWYLKEGQFVTRSDNGRYTITLAGVDLAESAAVNRSEPLKLNSRVA
ncbi:MAG TPA: J domain-containing protein [Bryobacteraceae bacterium]|nr:J domain-containing protein [Bryobacteraceae bacterium]